MLIRHIFMGFVGLAAGFGVSAGTFAFLIIIGVIPRMIGKCNRAAETLHFENAVILGGIFGNLASVFLDLRFPFGPLLLCVYGLSAGIFVGCMAVALAEILNTFPIVFRRMGLKVGLFWAIIAMAAGKLFGSLYYFLGKFTPS
ncbi:MAG: stage V sporulation protein AB [Roseburia sp.]|nr:stage V sporulation protein AB [Roseburia sp.]